MVADIDRRKIATTEGQLLLLINEKYYTTLAVNEQPELTAKRDEAREYIRVNEGVL